MKFSVYILFSISFIFGQWFDINYGGINRSYYVAYPPNSIEPAGLIINMHGFGGTAAAQIAGTQMNNYAHPQNLAVVYPQGSASGIGTSSWNIGTFWDFNNQDDVGFISAIIDEIALNFQINLNKIYACGFSNGGYLSFELACKLSSKIAAFASVAGHMFIDTYNDCSPTHPTPFLSINGTEDNYDGIGEYYLPVENSNNYWIDFAF